MPQLIWWVKSQLGINSTYNSNFTAWEFQIYWSNAEKYRTKKKEKMKMYTELATPHRVFSGPM